MFAWIFFFFFLFNSPPYLLLDTLVLSCSGPFICTLEFFSCKFVQWKILFSLDRKHGELKKKKAEIQIEEIYFCVKLFKNSVLYKRQKVLCTWCEYANTAIIKIDCMEKSYQDSFSSTITFDNVSSQGSDSSSGNADWEMCLLFLVNYCWVGRSYLYGKYLWSKLSRWMPATLYQLHSCAGDSLLSSVGDAPQVFYDAVTWLLPCTGSVEVCAVIESLKLSISSGEDPLKIVFQLFWHNVQIHSLWEHECTETYIFETVHCVLYCFFKNAGYPSELILFMWFHDLEFERPLE